MQSQRPFPGRRGERRGQPEPDHPGRDLQDRAIRIRRGSERQPATVEEFNDFPVKVVNGTPIYVRDVAHVRDGFAPQTNIVRQDGSRAALLTVLKAGNASTLAVVEGVRKMLPAVAATLPPELKIQPLADQSIFVRAAINGVIREAVIAACLTGIMILIFLGSWRSTLIIAVSIPLSILTSIMVLSFLHETINIMTLGGLALAVGILVDDATVDDRKHQALSGGRARPAHGHSGRRGADRRSRAGLHALHLHRVPAHVLPERRGALPVRAAGGSGGVRHAGLLRSFAHAGADAGDVPAAACNITRPQLQSVRAVAARLSSAASSACATAVRGPAGGAWCAAAWSSCRSFCWSAARPFCCSRGWARISFPPRTAASSSCTCAPRPARASRRPRASATWWSSPSAARFRTQELDSILDNIGLPYSSINTIYSNSGA